MTFISPEERSAVCLYPDLVRAPRMVLRGEPMEPGAPHPGFMR